MVLWLDGKSFADDLMVMPLGLTADGRKIPLGCVQTATENRRVLRGFLKGLMERGLRTDEGLLMVLDGRRRLRPAARDALRGKAAPQRCH